MYKIFRGNVINIEKYAILCGYKPQSNWNAEFAEDMLEIKFESEIMEKKESHGKPMTIWNSNGSRYKNKLRLMIKTGRNSYIFPPLNFLV
jgi:hypothetical protein